MKESIQHLVGRRLNGGHGKWFKVVMVDGIYLMMAVIVEGNTFLAFEFKKKIFN